MDSSATQGPPLTAVAAFHEVSIAQEPRRKRWPTPPPFSLRLTADERARLEADAGSKPLGAYIRSRLFGDSPSPRKRNLRRPVQDESALTRVLAELGRSRIANNLNQLAKSANCGSLLLSPEQEAILRTACAGVAAMRRDLMKALGLDAGDGS